MPFFCTSRVLRINIIMMNSQPTLKVGNYDEHFFLFVLSALISVMDTDDSSSKLRRKFPVPDT